MDRQQDCSSCGVGFTTEVDKKGVEVGETQYFYPRCVKGAGGVKECLRCSENKILASEDKEYCTECQQYVDSQ